ncbi:MAG: hypothetical protein ACT6RN_27290 [Agrobacterium sp.]
MLKILLYAVLARPPFQSYGLQEPDRLLVPAALGRNLLFIEEQQEEY